MGGACSAHGEDEKSVQNLVGKSQRKKLLGRPRRRRNNIKMDLSEIG
jgi:hypothetical protein